MASQRKILGRRIKAARRAVGYKSARAFADAIGVSESSIANAEIGSERVGAGVYMDIESGLGWPHNSIHEALVSGDFSRLQTGHATPDLHQRIVDDTDPFERSVMELDARPIEERWAVIFAHRERRRTDAGTTEGGRSLGQTG